MINEGGEQGGTVGFYNDESALHWIGLDSPNSSIPASLLLGDTFIDWSCDCDFGDMDNDGDLDLFHSTYGGAFGGNVPSRIFLNDGDGFFEEFNPSGFKLGSTNIANGNPGLWAQGTQQSNTSNNTGANCDIATSALDIDLMDMDGDLDLDVLHGARQEVPRIFRNLLEENGGVLAFRDVSTAVLPAGWASNDFNYEQEMGDIDNDGDLDLYGLNWNGFNDSMFLNNGNGVFTTSQASLANSGADDNEGDFLDYDNDGDLDLYVANFSGADKLYRNNFLETGVPTFTPVGGQIPFFSSVSLDADACDIDEDGDYDIMVAEDNNQANTYLRNDNNVPDTTAPSLYRLESASGGAADDSTKAVRVQVYDNAPYYITWYNETNLITVVDGFSLGTTPMMTSGGQIFRGEICNNYVGTVQYRASSADRYGNAAATGFQSFVNTGDTGTLSGVTSASSAGTPQIRALAEAFAGKPLPLVVSNVAPGAPVIFGFSLSSLPGVDFGDGIIANIGVPLVGDLIVVPANGNGDALLNITKAPGLAGLTLFTQGLALDGAGANTYASTQALSFTL